MELWRKRIIFVKCDIQAQEKYILSLLKRKRYVKDVTLHLELLGCRLLLGKYDDVKQEIDGLSRMDSSLKPEQRLLLQLCKFEYLISLSETVPLNAELENLENDLLKLRGKNDRIKQISLKGVRLCQYLIEEQWEDVLEFFKEASKENIMVCGQVITAYYRGKCCCHLGSYELVILYDGINVAYCLFEEIDSDYKIVESCRLEKNLEKNQAEPIGIELTESEKEIYQGSRTSGEIWMVLESFYKQNKIFCQEDTAYVGICSFPIVENVIVNGNPINIEDVIHIDDTVVYLWSVENVDLNTNI